MQKYKFGCGGSHSLPTWQGEVIEECLSAQSTLQCLWCRSLSLRSHNPHTQNCSMQSTIDMYNHATVLEWTSLGICQCRRHAQSGVKSNYGGALGTRLGYAHSPLQYCAKKSLRITRERFATFHEWLLAQSVRDRVRTYVGRSTSRSRVHVFLRARIRFYTTVFTWRSVSA